MTFSKSVLVTVAALAFLATPEAAWAQFAFLSSGPAIDTIETIETPDLQAKLSKQQSEREQAEKKGAAKPEPDFVVVDVRSDAEVKVSLIPGEITKAEFEQNSASCAGKTVIVYCTVGGRSTRYAQQLKAKDVSVINYKGSILAWVQAGLPLVTQAGKPTNRVSIPSDRYQIPSQYQAVSQTDG